MLLNPNIATDIPTHDILVGGVKINSAYHVKSIVIGKEANRIAYAQIMLFDGGEAREGFKISDGITFIPGNEIEIRAGYRSLNLPVFKGVIIKHSIKKTAKHFELIIDCKHPAINMTIGEKSKYFYNAQDNVIIEELVQPYGILLQAMPTKTVHKVMVQYQISDWEFMMMRAAANGQLVFTLNNEIKVASPDFSLPPGLVLDPGSIMEIESEMDAAGQLISVSASAWDPALQQVIRTEAAPPAYAEQGNLSANLLAGVTKHTTYEIRHTGNIDTIELQAWADARLLKSRLAKIRGRIKLQGNANVSPGDIVHITGVGMRFDGPVYVTGVRHSISSKNWETDIQFGLAPQLYPPLVAQKSNHTMLPPVSGLQIGVVVQLTGDPLEEDRILVRTPMISEYEPGVWARVNCLDAGLNRGAFFRPDINDEVVLGFIDNDPRYPLVLGMLNSSAKPAPIQATDDNPRKGFITRQGLKLIFDDQLREISLETLEGNTITISEQEKRILIKDSHQNSIEMNQGAIAVKSASNLNISAAGDINIEGVNITLRASAELKGEGSAGAEISAGGNTVIKGTMVMIN